MTDASQALSLIVSRRNSTLRKLTLDQLRVLPSLQLSIEPFGDIKVRLAIAVSPDDSGGIAVLMRGHVCPLIPGARIIRYEGFTKRPNGRWTSIIDPLVGDRLKHAIEEGAPWV